MSSLSPMDWASDSRVDACTPKERLRVVGAEPLFMIWVTVGSLARHLVINRFLDEPIAFGCKFVECFLGG